MVAVGIKRILRPRGKYRGILRYSVAFSARRAAPSGPNDHYDGPRRGSDYELMPKDPRRDAQARFRLLISGGHKALLLRGGLSYILTT